MKWNMGWFTPPNRAFDLPLYLVTSLLTITIYLPLAAWLSVAAGLKIRTQSRAILAAAAGLVVVCAAPLLFITTPLAFSLGPWGQHHELVPFSCVLRPASIVFLHVLHTPPRP